MSVHERVIFRFGFGEPGEFVGEPLAFCDDVGRGEKGLDVGGLFVGWDVVCVEVRCVG